MPQIIAVSNQKGGVGKTTTAVNLAACLGAMEYKTLLIDLDPQSNATSALGIDTNNIEASIYDSLIDNRPPAIYNLTSKFHGMYLIPSTIDLAGAEIDLMDSEDREKALLRTIAMLNEDFDFIIIDSPPSLGLLTINSLVVADWVLIPVQAEYLALEGLSRMIVTIQRIKQAYNPSLEILGIITTLFDGRTNLSNQVLAELRRAFPEKVFKATIRRGVRLSEAPSFGKPIIYYDPGSIASMDYAKLTREVIDVCEKRGLGRGLDSLLGSEAPPTKTKDSPNDIPRGLMQLPVVLLVPNPFQPRKHIDADALEELAVSIEQKGIMNPILIRKQDDEFQIIAGNAVGARHKELV